MLYIHIPYCKGKCIYCDFYSAGNPDFKRYLKAVITELTERIGEIQNGSLSSIYIGGGTPSLIPAKVFSEFASELFYTLDAHGVALEKDAEITIEVNPEDVTSDLAATWVACGINRVSMGVQTMNRSELTFLRRRHSADKVADALSTVKSYFNNISVDVIYGIPGQTPDSLAETLRELITYRPTHLSAYSLTYEPKTPLYLLREQKKIREVPEEEHLRLEEYLVSYLANHGYDRYEISNYALPGYQSRHNGGYWRGKAYLGLGPSACSFDGEKIRRNNPPDIKKYLHRFSKEKCQPSEDTSEIYRNPFYLEEILSSEERREETIFTELRTKEGIYLEEYLASYGPSNLETLLKKAEKWIKTGDMFESGNRLRFTSKGLRISDHIIVELL